MTTFNKLFLIGIGLGFFLSAHAQEASIEDILKTGRADAATLAEHYFQPMFDGFGYAFSNGWYNTAKPHKSLGFDLTVTMNVARVPKSAKFFTIDESEYNSITLADPSNNQSPTVFGPDQPGPMMNYSFTEPESGYTFTGSFDGWRGVDLKQSIGFDIVPAPTIQAGVGIIKSTEIILRYTPNIKTKVENGNNKVGVFGVGLKHEIGQWIPGLKRVPIDISLLAAYSGLNDTYTFDAQNAAKKAIFDVDNWTVQLLVSKKVSVLTFYGGFGYTSIKSKFNLKGTYELTYNNLPPLKWDDPISLNYKRGNYKGTLGMRLKFGVFTLHGDYTFQEYNIISTGIGVAFR